MLQVRHRFLVDARLQVDFGEHRIGVEPEDQGGGEASGVGLPRLRRAIAGPVHQDQIDAALFAVDYQPSLGGEVHRRLVALVGIGDHQFLPARLAGIRLLLRVQHPARKILVEDPGLDLRFDPLRDDAEGDFAEGLVGVRDGDDHDVAGRKRRQHRQETDRPKQPVWAHATGQQRHRLPIPGHPPEANQDPHQDRHRNREPERLRQERPQDPDGGAPGHPLGEQVLQVVHHRRQHQEEREDQQRQEERRQDFLEHVAVEGRAHRDSRRVSLVRGFGVRGFGGRGSGAGRRAAFSIAANAEDRGPEMMPWSHRISNPRTASPRTPAS